MIQVQNLTKRYGNLVAIDNVSFRVGQGEILGFLGPNGAGKTTTMRIISGYMPPTDGTVRVGDFDVLEDPIKAKRQIGYLPENPPLYNDMTVQGYLDFVADIKNVSGKNKKAKIDLAMERCGITDVRKRLIGNLSFVYNYNPKQIIEIRYLIKSLAGDRTVI